MICKKVLVIGGAGRFGSLLIEDLRRSAECEVVAPGRHAVDLQDPVSIDAALAGISVAICAAGPFQTLPTTLAEGCMQHGVHYIDLADDRSFVKKVRSLTASTGVGGPSDSPMREAGEAGVPSVGRTVGPTLGRAGDPPAVCTGWSTASALSGSLVRIGAAGLERIEEIYIHMAPGNRLARGNGTIASLLHSVGRPLSIWRDGRWQTVTGWSAPRRFSFPPPIGVRSGYLVDAPDHDLFPELFGARTVEFRAASELPFLNAAVSFLGWLARRRVVRSWAPWSRILGGLAALPASMGHDWGGIGVEVLGWSRDRRVSRRACVVAHSGGQRIAVMPASIMTSMLLSGSTHRGLASPADWITHEQLRLECEKRGFQLIVEEP